MTALLGILASATSTVPTVAPTIVSSTSGAGSGGSAFGPMTMNVNMPGSLSAGNDLYVAIGGQRPNSDMSPTLPGFTLIFSGIQTTGTSRGFLLIFRKFNITGSEGTVTFTQGTNGAGNAHYFAFQATGVAGVEVPDSDGVGYSTSGTFTLNSNTVTTTGPRRLLVSAAGGRCQTGGDVSESWGGGASVEFGAASSQIAFVTVATETLESPASRTHTCQITNTQGNPASVIGTIVLLPYEEGVDVWNGPMYVPEDHRDKYNLDTGGFNFHPGNTTKIAALADAGTELHQQMFYGDSVGEGWTSLVGTSVSADRLNAFPLIYRNYVASELGVPVAGTGHVRCRSVQLIEHYHDSRWNNQTVNTVNWSNGVHHVTAANSTVQPIVFTPDKPGTIVEIYCIDRAGALNVTIDGGTPQVISGGNTNLPITHQITGLANTAHTVSIRPNTNTAITVCGASVHNSTGLLLHNPSQGGSKVRTGTAGQDFWPDTSLGTGNMLPTYSHANMHGDVDVLFIELGGNDLQNLDPTTEAAMQPIFAGYQALADAHPNADIVLLIPAQGGSGFDADYPLFMELCMELAIDNDWCAIDTQFILGGYANIIAQGWGTDAYGHLNTTGATYLGEAVAQAVLAGAGLI